MRFAIGTLSVVLRGLELLEPKSTQVLITMMRLENAEPRTTNTSASPSRVKRRPEEAAKHP